MNLAKLLVSEGIVSEAQVKECTDTCKDTGQGVSESLVELGYATETQIVEFLSVRYGVPSMDIDGCEVDESLFGLVPGETAIEKFLVPIGIEGPDLMIAVSDPSNILMLDDLGFITGKNIKPVVASERSIREKLARYYGAFNNADSPRDDEGSVDTDPQGVRVEGSLHSSAIGSQQEDIARDLEQSEGGYSYINRDESAKENKEEPQSAIQLDVSGTGQTNPDKNVFDLTNDTRTQVVLPHSDTGEDKDLSELGGNNTEDAILSSEEEDSEAQALKPAGTVSIEDVKESESAPLTTDRNPAGPGKVINGTGRTVLIVDISPTVRKIMTMTLERAGYRVCAAGDGMQALARINETIPDLVLIDIKLPHMDGYQLCKIIKSHGLTKSVPVILVSGKTGVLDKMKVKMAGASDMITKPFQAGVLVEAAGRHAVRGQLTE